MTSNQSSSRKLAGRVRAPIVLVTGANRGIGFEICRQLAARGAEVVLTARRKDAGKRAASKLAAQKVIVHFHPLDVSSRKSIAGLREFLKRTYGRLDVLINNAGVIAKNDSRAFHSTALCSPSRAAIITGRNHHSVGFGVIAEQATGYPGYDAIIGVDNATIGAILKDNGYATSWFGKNHNTPDYQYSTAGPFGQWPTGMGFEYFYGFMGGETDQWTPFLFRNTTQIFPWRDQPGYNMITGMADDAIQYLKQVNAAAPDKPFFLYYVPGGSHAPHQPTPEWIEKFKGKFDMGWEKLREQIFANQKRLGVIPPNTTLTPWPDGQPEYGGAKLAKWDTLSADEKKLFARQAEVFAAYVAYTDHEIGRVIQAVDDMGKLDNTLVIYISGDNGTSAEGTILGTPFDLAALEGIEVPVADQLKVLRCLGFPGDHSPHGSGLVVGL